MTNTKILIVDDEEVVRLSHLRSLEGTDCNARAAEDGREALTIMVELNNKYAVDGRDPNSYSGIFWVLGRYDRAWGPERPIFGKIRYMSSANTLRKLRMSDYMARFGGQAAARCNSAGSRPSRGPSIRPSSAATSTAASAGSTGLTR